MTRVRKLSEEVYRHAFELLDAEPELSGDDAGRIASRCQREFERAYESLVNKGR